MPQKIQPMALRGCREAMMAPTTEKVSTLARLRIALSSSASLPYVSSTAAPDPAVRANAIPPKRSATDSTTRGQASQEAARDLLRPLNPVPLFLPSRSHYTGRPSPRRYGTRYEAKRYANFLELRKAEVRRINLPRGWVNKGLSSLLSRLTPEPGDPSCDDCGYPYGYELTHSVPCANPYQHLPQEAPRVEDAPVHVAAHVTPKTRALPPLQVCVPYNQHGS